MITPEEERPGALLPQVRSILENQKLVVMFIRRVKYQFFVSTFALADDSDGGNAVIKKFLEDYHARRIDLASTIRCIDNEQLTEVPEIAQLLALKDGER